MMRSNGTIVGDGEACNFVDKICPDDQICVLGNDGVHVKPRLMPRPVQMVGLSHRLRATQMAGQSMVTRQWCDHRAGSCGGGGGGQIYTYTADADGSYVFKVDAKMENVFPAVYIRRLCDYDFGSYGRDLACSADETDRNGTASVSTELSAGDQVFVFVDSYYGAIDDDGDMQADRFGSAGQGPYGLKVYRANAPNIVSADVSVSAIRKAFSLRVTWSDPDGDVVQIGTQFLDANGAPLPYLSRDDGTVLTEGYIRLSDVQNEGDRYSTVLTVDLTAVSNAILEIDQAVAMNVFAVMSPLKNQSGFDLSSHKRLW